MNHIWFLIIHEWAALPPSTSRTHSVPTSWEKHCWHPLRAKLSSNAGRQHLNHHIHTRRRADAHTQTHTHTQTCRPDEIVAEPEVRWACPTRQPSTLTLYCESAITETCGLTSFKKGLVEWSSEDGEKECFPGQRSSYKPLSGAGLVLGVLGSYLGVGGGLQPK